MQGDARAESWQITRNSPQKSRAAAGAGYFLDTWVYEGVRQFDGLARSVEH
jgi:hypothetical protein